MTRELAASNLFAWTLQIAVVVAVGALLPLLFRLRNPRTQVVYLQGLLALCLLLPVVQPWRRAELPAGAGIGPVIKVSHIPVVPPPSDWAIADIASGIVIAGVGLRLLWLGIGLLRLRRLRRTALPLQPLPPALARAIASTGVNVPICVSGEVDSPVTFGFIQPIVLLPAKTLSLDADAQTSIAAHELIHVRRADWIYAFAEELAGIAFWFHPAIWWLVAQIRLTREQCVDREVLSLTVQPEVYVSALLAMAAPRLQPDFSPAPPFLRRHHLNSRVRSLFTEVNMNKRRLALSYASIAAALAACGWIATQQFPLNAAPQSAVAVDLRPVFYPPEAKAKRIEGSVAVEVKISEDGSVLDARVTSGPDELRKAALQSVLQWHFRNDEKAVKFTSVTVEFRLAGGKGPVKDSASGVVVEAVDPPAVPDFPPGTGPRVKIGGNAQSAKRLNKVTPVYPAEAKQARIQGTVRHAVLIDPSGKVSALQLVAGHPLLVPAAAEAIKQWTYQQTLLNGNPVEVVSMIDVNFTLAP